MKMGLDWFLYWKFLLNFESGIAIVDISDETRYDSYPTPKYYYGAQTEEDEMGGTRIMKRDKIWNKIWSEYLKRSPCVEAG
jgi:hypothetical protein